MKLICNICKEEKDLSYFVRGKTYKTGYAPYCRDCRRAKQQKYRAENPEKYKEANLRWSRSPKFLEWQRRHQDRTFSRKRFDGIRDKILDRDEHKCVKCGMSREDHRVKWNVDITIDHIDGDVSNNSLDNLTTLCLSCHGKKDCARRKTVGVPYSVNPFVLPEKKCETCGKTFNKRDYKISSKNWSKVKFCSRKCFHNHVRLSYGLPSL